MYLSLRILCRWVSRFHLDPLLVICFSIRLKGGGLVDRLGFVSPYSGCLEMDYLYKVFSLTLFQVCRFKTSHGNIFFIF